MGESEQASQGGGERRAEEAVISQLKQAAQAAGVQSERTDQILEKLARGDVLTPEDREIVGTIDLEVKRARVAQQETQKLSPEDRADIETTREKIRRTAAGNKQKPKEKLADELAELYQPNSDILSRIKNFFTGK